MTRTLARPSIVTVGRLLAALVADEDFQEAWTRGLPAFQSRTRSHLVPLPGGILYRATVFDPTAGGWSPPFVALRSLVRQVGIGFAAHGDLARAAAAPASHRAFSALARTAATAFARISARDWESPPFDLWLVLARLSRLAPETLAGVRGLALLRWRRPGESEWQPPRGRRLSAGLSQELRRTGVFPFG